MLTLPKPGNRARLVTIAAGMVVFFWLSVEDNGAFPVALLGTLISLCAMLWWTGKNYGSGTLTPRFWLPGGVLIGAITGAGAVLCAVLLMFFKTAWHSHIFPDYPMLMMLDMLARLPAWTLTGALVGLAAGLIYATRTENAV